VLYIIISAIYKYEEMAMTEDIKESASSKPTQRWSGFETEYLRLKDDILFRLNSTNQFELGAVTSMGVILTLGNVLGGGEFFYFGNLATGIVLFGCAQCVVPNIHTVYSAHAYIRVQRELGRYPDHLIWDDNWAGGLDSGVPSTYPPQGFHIRLSHHSFLFLCLAIINVLALVMVTIAKSRYMEGMIVLTPSLVVLWPIWRIEYIYRKCIDRLYKHWIAALR
jgi:hypothetical protein